MSRRVGDPNLRTVVTFAALTIVLVVSAGVGAWWLAGLALVAMLVLTPVTAVDTWRAVHRGGRRDRRR